MQGGTKSTEPHHPGRYHVFEVYPCCPYISIVHFIILFFFFYYLFKKNFFKERERNINVWLALTHPPLGTRPPSRACVLTGNQTSNPLVYRPMLNPLNHTSQGCFSFFKSSPEDTFMHLRGREKHGSVASHLELDGTEPVNFWCWGHSSNQVSPSARSVVYFFLLLSNIPLHGETMVC